MQKKKKPSNGKVPSKKKAVKKSSKKKVVKVQVPNKEKLVKHLNVKILFEAKDKGSISDMKLRMKMALSALVKWHHIKYDDRKMEWEVIEQK